MKMGPGDSVFYAGTALGAVFEISVSTGAIRRSFSVSSTVADLDISADGKTLFVADGTGQVSMTPLATGGLSGSIDFGLAVTGVAETPDANQLWVSQGNAVYAAPADGNSFNPSLVAGRVTVAGTALTRIVFNPFGNVAIVIDDAGNQLVIIK
jgi:DNA-binding beta-propeller fold protein YncE